MTIELQLLPEVVARLHKRIAVAEITLEEFVRQAVEEKLAKQPTLAEILAPIHAETARLGWTEADVDALFNECRDEVWQERRRAQENANPAAKAAPTGDHSAES